jgi:hypothetical protein
VKTQAVIQVLDFGSTMSNPICVSKAATTIRRVKTRPIRFFPVFLLSLFNFSRILNKESRKTGKGNQGFC